MKKKISLIPLLFLCFSIYAQQDVTSTSPLKPTAITVKGIYGASEVYSARLPGVNSSGGIGFGVGAKIPLNKAAIDVSLDFTTSASRNNLGIQALYDWNFLLIKDEKIKIDGYAGVGLGFGRIFNDKDYFFAAVEDFNYYGMLFNAGAEFQPVGKPFLAFFEINPGIINVPGWSESTQMPFKFSLGVRFYLK